MHVPFTELRTGSLLQCILVTFVRLGSKVFTCSPWNQWVLLKHEYSAGLKIWMLTVHPQYQGSYTATLTLSDKVPLCKKFRTRTALPFLIPPSLPDSIKAITNFIWKLHPFYRRGLICFSEGPQQKHELPECDDNCSHRPHSCQRCAPELQLSTDSPEQWGCSVLKAATEIPGFLNSVILPVLPVFMFDVD